MANNVIMRRITVAAAYQALAAEPTVATFTVAAAATNGNNVIFEGDTGDEVPWVPGEWHSFRSVDLSKLRVKGSAGDVVIVVGGTW